MNDPIEGLVAHRPRQLRLFLESLEVEADIGFHDHEIGTPQRLALSIEVWVDPDRLPSADEEAEAWNYDRLRGAAMAAAGERRYNLQETLVQGIFDRVASMAGVRALRIRSVKPDIYADAAGVGVEVASFPGSWPD